MMVFETQIITTIFFNLSKYSNDFSIVSLLFKTIVPPNNKNPTNS